MTDLNRVVIISILFIFIRAEQLIQENPQDQQAIIGDRTVLKCRFKNLQGEPQWCIDDFCLGVSKNDIQNKIKNGTIHLKGRPRYKILGDRLKGEFHLLIEPVQLQDNMFFYCMATAASETIKAVKSKKIFLTVLTYPHSIHLDSPVHVSLNKPSSIQCRAKQSRPPVKILMSINGNIIYDESKYKTEILQYSINQDDKKYGYISSISSISNENLRQSYYDTITNLTIDDATIKMEGQSVECFAYSLFYSNQNYQITHKTLESSLQQQNNQNLMTAKSKIQVDYAPEVNLKLISSNKILREEDVVSLLCETKATPQIQSYKWYIGKNYIKGVKEQTLNLKLRREMHSKTITCEASNTVASVKASLQLKILFKPSFKKGPKSFIVVDRKNCNKPLTLDCQVTSNPKSNITWYRRKFVSIPSKTDLKNGRKVPYLYLVGLSSRLFTDKEQLYEDQLIGYGPTYTISSFNCANLIDDVKSPTKLKIKKAKRNSDNLNDVDTFRPVSYSTEYYDNYDYYDYDREDFDNDQYDEKPSQEMDHLSSEFNDFGIYICDASNRISEETETRSIRRYIKINPSGPPIGKLFSFNQNYNAEEQLNLLMKTQEVNEENSLIPELAASIGSSITLTCLVEPLPYLDSLIWIKDNGKIIPNSRLSISEQIISNLTNKTVLSKQNYKIKHENLTILNQKSQDFDNYEEDQDIEEENFNFELSKFRNELVTSSSGIKTTDFQSILFVRSTLHIKNIRKQDFGIYKCKFSNSFGSRVSMILLREKNFLDRLNLSNYIVFILFVITIFMCLILFLMCFWCFVSSNLRRKYICCFFDTKSRPNLVKNDPKINDWLNSTNRQLHLIKNETSIKQLKTCLNKDNTYSTTTEPLLISSNSPLINESSKSTKTSQTLTSSPRNESMGNSSSLVDEEDDDAVKLENKFPRFLVSSPMNGKSLSEDQPSMLLIRSQNFNAKISNCESMENRLANTLQRQHLNKLIKKKEDSPYRLSDLFNELSPMNSFSDNNAIYGNNNTTFSPVSTLTQSPSSRLINNNTNNKNLTLNKFPNPFSNDNFPNNSFNLPSSSNQSYFHHLNI
ncbi:unnamed protein product [Brachionus calyciflorus]|uniref:Ig-like domain-containing protein n=1 Tax=Brachionus calyciflorus TaxID=104777 RepID=A0A813T7V3_9BILA|nr:unnamed protein product [Brachionus calyciflorus]